MAHASMTTFHEELLPKIKYAGWLMVSLSSVIAAAYGWNSSAHLLDSTVYAIAYGAASFLLAWMVVAATMAFREKAWGVAAMATLAAITTGAVEFGSSFGYKAAASVGNVHQAALKDTAHEFSLDALKKLEEKRDRLLAERNTWKPVNSRASANAVIASTEARPLFQKTNGCKEFKGSTSRSMCEAYNTAQADVAMWEQIAAQEIKINSVEDEIKEAKKQAQLNESGVSFTSAQADAIASGVTLSLAPSDETKKWVVYGAAMLNSLWLLLIGTACFTVYYGLQRPDVKQAVRKAAEFAGEAALSAADLPAPKAPSDLSIERARQLLSQASLPSPTVRAAA